MEDYRRRYFTVDKKPWYRRKTVWAAVGTSVAAIGGYLTGDIGLGPALQTVAGCLIAIFLRDAVG
jgi:hypothetical protein